MNTKEAMRYLPINLNVQGKPVLLVGGGTVALRKCNSLVAAGARVMVCAPEIVAGLQILVRDALVDHQAKAYEPTDLTGVFLVIAATGHAEVNQRVAADARAIGVLTEVVDAPESGNFTSPAVISRGDLLISVATGGKAPALSAAIRADLECHFGPEYAIVTALMGTVREKLLTERGNRAYNKKILNELAERLPELVRKDATTEIDLLLQRLCGLNCSLASLKSGSKDIP